MKFVRIIAVLLLAIVSVQAADGEFESEWKTEVLLNQIGGDLHQSYVQLIDYLLPRTRSSASAAYTMVLRFRRAGHPEQQINISVSRDKKPQVSVWLLQLPSELQFNSSDSAKQLASEIHVTKKRVLLSPELQQLVTNRLGKGFATTLHGGIVIHGDIYDFWATSDSTNFEVHQTPGKTRDELTEWMDQVRIAAQR